MMVEKQQRKIRTCTDTPKAEDAVGAVVAVLPCLAFRSVAFSGSKIAESADMTQRVLEKRLKIHAISRAGNTVVEAL